MSNTWIEIWKTPKSVHFFFENTNNYSSLSKRKGFFDFWLEVTHIPVEF